MDESISNSDKTSKVKNEYDKFKEKYDEANQTYQQEEQNLQTLKKSIDDKILEINNKLFSYKNEVNNINDNSIEYDKNIDDLENLKEKVELLEQNIKDIIKKANENKYSEEAASKLKELKKEILEKIEEKLSIIKTKKDNESERITKLNKEAENFIKNLTEKLDNFKKENEFNKKDILQEEIDKLFGDIDEFLAQNEKDKNDFKFLKYSELDSLVKAQKSTWENDKQTYAQIKSKFSKDFETVEKLYEELKQELTSADTSEKIKSLVNKIDPGALGKVNKLIEDATKYKHNLVESNGLKAKIEEILKQAKEKLKIADGEIKNKKTKLEAKIKELNEAISNVENANAIDNLEAKIKILKELILNTENDPEFNISTLESEKFKSILSVVNEFKTTLSNAKTKLSEAKTKLSKEKKEIEDKVREALQKVDDAIKKADDAIKMPQGDQIQKDNRLKALQKAHKDLSEARIELDKVKINSENYKIENDKVISKITELEKKQNQLKQILDQALADENERLEKIKKELKDQVSNLLIKENLAKKANKISNRQSTLNDLNVELEESQKLFDKYNSKPTDEKEKYKEELKTLEDQISQSKKEVEDLNNALEKDKKKIDDKIAEFDKKLKDIKKIVDDININSPDHDTNLNLLAAQKSEAEKLLSEITKLITDSHNEQYQEGLAQKLKDDYDKLLEEIKNKKEEIEAKKDAEKQRILGLNKTAGDLKQKLEEELKKFNKTEKFSEKDTLLGNIDNIFKEVKDFFDSIDDKDKTNPLFSNHNNLKTYSEIEKAKWEITKTNYAKIKKQFDDLLSEIKGLTESLENELNEANTIEKLKKLIDKIQNIEFEKAQKLVLDARKYDHMLDKSIEYETKIKNILKDAKTKLQAESGEVENKRKDLAKKIEELNNASNNAKNALKVDDLTSKIQVLQDLINNIKSDNKYNNQTLNDPKFNSILGTINQFKKSLADAESELNSSKNRLDVKKKEIEEKVREVLQKADDAIKKVDDAIKMPQGDQVEKSNRLKALEQVKSVLSEARIELDKVKASSENYKTENEKIISKIIELEKKQEELKQALAKALTDENERIEKIKEELKNQTKNLLFKENLAKNANKILNRQSTLSDLNLEIVKANILFNKYNVNSDEEKSKYMTWLKALKDQIDSSIKKHKELNDSLEVDKKKIDDKIAELDKNLKDIKKIVDNINVDSLDYENNLSLLHTQKSKVEKLFSEINKLVENTGKEQYQEVLSQELKDNYDKLLKEIEDKKNKIEAKKDAEKQRILKLNTRANELKQKLEIELEKFTKTNIFLEKDTLLTNVDNIFKEIKEFLDSINANDKINSHFSNYQILKEFFEKQLNIWNISKETYSNLKNNHKNYFENNIKNLSKILQVELNKTLTLDDILKFIDKINNIEIPKINSFLENANKYQDKHIETSIIKKQVEEILKLANERKEITQKEIEELKAKIKEIIKKFQDHFISMGTEGGIDTLLNKIKNSEQYVEEIKLKYDLNHLKSKYISLLKELQNLDIEIKNAEENNKSQRRRFNSVKSAEDFRIEETYRNQEPKIEQIKSTIKNEFNHNSLNLINKAKENYESVLKVFKELKEHIDSRIYNEGSTKVQQFIDNLKNLKNELEQKSEQFNKKFSNQIKDLAKKLDSEINKVKLGDKNTLNDDINKLKETIVEAKELIKKITNNKFNNEKQILQNSIKKAEEILVEAIKKLENYKEVQRQIEEAHKSLQKSNQKILDHIKNNYKKPEKLEDEYLNENQERVINLEDSYVKKFLENIQNNLEKYSKFNMEIDELKEKYSKLTNRIIFLLNSKLELRIKNNYSKLASKVTIDDFETPNNYDFEINKMPNIYDSRTNNFAFNDKLGFVFVGVNYWKKDDPSFKIYREFKIKINKIFNPFKFGNFTLRENVLDYNKLVNDLNALKNKEDCYEDLKKYFKWDNEKTNDSEMLVKIKTLWNDNLVLEVLEKGIHTSNNLREITIEGSLVTYSFELKNKIKKNRQSYIEELKDKLNLIRESDLNLSKQKENTLPSEIDFNEIDTIMKKTNSDVQDIVITYILLPDDENGKLKIGYKIKDEIYEDNSINELKIIIEISNFKKFKAKELNLLKYQYDFKKVFKNLLKDSSKYKSIWSRWISLVLNTFSKNDSFTYKHDNDGKLAEHFKNRNVILNANINKFWFETNQDNIYLKYEKEYMFTIKKAISKKETSIENGFKLILIEEHLSNKKAEILMELYYAIFSSKYDLNNIKEKPFRSFTIYHEKTKEGIYYVDDFAADTSLIPNFILELAQIDKNNPNFNALINEFYKHKNNFDYPNKIDFRNAKQLDLNEILFENGELEAQQSFLFQAHIILGFFNGLLRNKIWEKTNMTHLSNKILENSIIFSSTVLDKIEVDSPKWRENYLSYSKTLDYSDLEIQWEKWIKKFQ